MYDEHPLKRILHAIDAWVSDYESFDIHDARELAAAYHAKCAEVERLTAERDKVRAERQRLYARVAELEGGRDE